MICKKSIFAEENHPALDIVSKIFRKCAYFIIDPTRVELYITYITYLSKYKKYIKNFLAQANINFLFDRSEQNFCFNVP